MEEPTRPLASLTTFEVNQWSSFKVPLSKFLHLKPFRVVELGAGYFSTPYLAQHCSGNLITIETNTLWLKEVEKHLESINISNVDLRHMNDSNIPAFIDSICLSTDLILVDHVGDRVAAVNYAINADIPIVVLHDYEAKDFYSFNLQNRTLWHNIGQKDPNMDMVINPTAIITKDQSILSILRNG